MAYSKENATCVEQAAQRKKALRMPRLLSDSIYLKLDWPSRFCTSFYVIFLTLLVVLFFSEIYLFELRDINDKKTISYTALCILKKKKKKKKQYRVWRQTKLQYYSSRPMPYWQTAKLIKRLHGCTYLVYIYFSNLENGVVFPIASLKRLKQSEETGSLLNTMISNCY